MEFTGRVKAILPKRSGTSARTGNEWVALPFIFEYFEEDNKRYADRVLLETFDTKVIENIKEGMEVRCGFSHNVREYEGKTYNEIRLYKIECVKADPQTQQEAAQAATDASTGNQSTQQPNAPQEGEKGDDLPF